MNINRKILNEGLLYSKLKNVDKAIKRFEERFGYSPNQVWINENCEFECDELAVVKKHNILENHYYITKTI